MSRDTQREPERTHAKGWGRNVQAQERTSYYTITVGYPTLGIQCAGDVEVYQYHVRDLRRRGEALIFVLADDGRTLIELDRDLRETGRRYERDLDDPGWRGTGRVIGDDGRLYGWDAPAIVAAIAAEIGADSLVSDKWIY